MSNLKRRDFLRLSAILTGAAAAGSLGRIDRADAAPIAVPTVDKLNIQVLVDGAYDTFSRPQKVNGVQVEVIRTADFARPFHAQWGL